MCLSTPSCAICAEKSRAGNVLSQPPDRNIWVRKQEKKVACEKGGEGSSVVGMAEDSAFAYARFHVCRFCGSVCLHTCAILVKNCSCRKRS